jgi:hypothetical protein
VHADRVSPTIVEGVKLSNERQHRYNLDTGGGAYVGGSVQTGGGDFVGRDSINPTVHGSVGNLFAGANEKGTITQGDRPSLVEFKRALDDFAKQVESAEMSSHLRKAIIDDVDSVASQVELQEEPDKELILHKAESIDRLLGKMATTTTSLTGLAEFAHRIFEWASQLLQ